MKRSWIAILTVLTYLVDKHAQQTIEYLKEENRILYQKLGKKRLTLTDQERRILAVKAKPLGRRLLAETTTLFSANTILGWYRKLVGQKYDGSANRKGGRPKVSKEIIDLVLRFKKENPHWGYGRIHGYLVYLGFQVSRATVQRIHTHPNGDWIKHVARNLTDWEEGFLKDKRFRILTNEAQLRYVLGEYVEYYHHERFHKGLGQVRALRVRLADEVFGRFAVPHDSDSRQTLAYYKVSYKFRVEFSVPT